MFVYPLLLMQYSNFFNKLPRQGKNRTQSQSGEAAKYRLQQFALKYLQATTLVGK